MDWNVHDGLKKNGTRWATPSLIEAEGAAEITERCERSCFIRTLLLSAEGMVNYPTFERAERIYTPGNIGNFCTETPIFELAHIIINPSGKRSTMATVEGHNFICINCQNASPQNEVQKVPWNLNDNPWYAELSPQYLFIDVYYIEGQCLNFFIEFHIWIPIL